MNYPRLAFAVIAATIANVAYGFIVYGNLLTSSFLAQAGIYRSAEAQMANMPLGAAALLLAITAAAMIFAASAFRGVGGGLWFGLLLGVFAIGTNVVVDYATINMTDDHAARLLIATLGEWLVVGAVIGAIYRPRG